MRPHRLVGPGHQIFILVTGVRIPLGTPIFLVSVIQTFSHISFFLVSLLVLNKYSTYFKIAFVLQFHIIDEQALLPA